ncbi:hypothetical protein [Methylomonas sp. 11b]|uniref:hypothetical protein n=1 Tax=Methylomonas sp. 11b TaxID=1168169 RepID=UPI00047CBC27|nr:hypothetical protein [Methylomonas sp. 11b]
MARLWVTALLLLAGCAHPECTKTTVWQVTPHKDPVHPVPPPKGWIYDAGWADSGGLIYTQPAGDRVIQDP